MHTLLGLVLRTINSRTLLVCATAKKLKIEPFLLPNAHTVELSRGVEFADKLENHLRQGEPPASVLLLPPLLRRRSLPRAFRKEYPFRCLEDVAIERALNRLPPGTPIAVLLPPNFLGSEGYRVSREALHPHLRMVFEIDRPWPGLHPKFRIHFAVFEKIGTSSSVIPPLRFFRVPESTTHPEHQSRDDIGLDLEKLLEREGGSTRWGFVLREGLAAGEPWVFDLYSPQAAAFRDDLQKIGDVRPLGELADFIPTNRLGNPRASLLDSDQNEGVPLLAGRNIGLNGELHWDQVRYRIAKPKSLLKAGDICLRAFLNSSGILVTAQIPDNAPPLAAEDTLIGLRKKEETTLEEWQVLVDFLPSFKASRLIAPLSGNLVRLNRSHLRKLPVPVPDQALQLALRKLNDAAANFESWRNEALQQKRALFSVAGSQEGRNRVLQAGKRARQRHHAAKLVEKTSFRIRTQYPYPLAYRWRVVEARHEGLEDYLNVLECAEATLCYLALVAIVGAQSQGLRIGGLQEIGRQLIERKAGISLGNWISVLQEVGGPKISRASSAFPFPEVLRVLAQSDTKEAVAQLKKARNDHAHGRGPKGSQVAKATEQRCADLEGLLASVDFLSDYPLRLVEKATRDSLKGRTQIRYRDLMGDHPLVPFETDEQESAELENGSLYFVDSAGHYHLARPWLTWRFCPECRRPSVFHLDRYDNKVGVAKLKSLEHGHGFDDKEIAAVFRSLEFLK